MVSPDFQGLLPGKRRGKSFAEKYKVTMEKMDSAPYLPRN
jgi:hypothetical protein